MGSLSSILRRLRTMPPKTLAAKLYKVGEETKVSRAYRNSEELAEAVQGTTGRNKLRYLRPVSKTGSGSAGYYDQPGAVREQFADGRDPWDDIEKSRTIQEDRARSNDIMVLLRAIRRKGHQGLPPRGKR
jgi:hypothetical protein